MSPTHQRGGWIHDFEDEPYLFYYEIGDYRYATRKIEGFKDGRTVRATEEDLERDPMALPDQPMEEINASQEFRTCEITEQEFEEA